MTTCLYCQAHGPFTTVDHVIPESLGNDDLLLEGDVCDRCQAYFGKEVERYVLEKTPIAVWRVILGIPTKKGRPPSVSVSQSHVQKGTFPERNRHHDNVGFTAHPDGTTSVDINDDEIVRDIADGTKGQFNLVLTPKLLHMLGRFLGKIGLGILAISDGVRARDSRFDRVRRYARFGEFEELWPIFSYSESEIGQWRRPKLLNSTGQTIVEDVDLYAYGFFEVANRYTLFRFSMGVDNWVICLDDPYPSPVIRSAFPDQDLKLIWYPSEEWRSNHALHADR